MKRPSKNISLNNSHLEFLASNDPDCCAECFMVNPQWPGGFFNQKEQRP
jgi:hypothetical protein